MSKHIRCDRCKRGISADVGLWAWQIIVPMDTKSKNLVFDICSDCKIEFTDYFMKASTPTIKENHG